MRLTRPTQLAVVLFVLGTASCGGAERPSIGQQVPPAPPTTRWPQGHDTATTIPGTPGGDPWADAIDVPTDADPCALLTNDILEAALGTGDYEPLARDDSICRATDGHDTLRIEIRGYEGSTRELAGSVYQRSHPKLSLEAVTPAPASIIYSEARRETAVFLVSSMLLFEYSDLADQQAFFDALVVAMRRPGTG